MSTTNATGTGWFLGRDTRTGETLQIPEVSAMMRFEDIPAHIIVWTCNGEGRPKLIARKHLARIAGGA